MSGGFFDYQQVYINDIADQIETYILNDLENHDIQNPKVIKEIENGLKLLRIAAVYAKRIDWLVSGDNSEETFLERLTDELKFIP